MLDATEVNGAATTQPNDLAFAPTTVLHVNGSAATGGDGSVAKPFRKIQDAVNQAGPGTQVLVADGIYHEAVTFPASGAAGNWIQVKAEGSSAILDGSTGIAGNAWKSYQSKSNVWFTKISASIKYLARDGKRFYLYDDRSGLLKGRGHNGVTMNEGWYFEPTTLRLYVRSLDNPANHSWQVPILNHAFEVTGRDGIWIEGFQMRYYGTRTDGCGVCTLNASHVVIRKNKIHNMQLGIYVNWTGNDEQGNDTRIEYNEIYDPPVNEWPWDAVKSSTMEGTGIVLRGHIGAIVRGNNIHNFFNGIYTGSSGALEYAAVAFDADIYNNHIYDISDDALEPEGTCVNHRFRNNFIDSTFVGVSLAPITQGPTWVLRNLVTNYTSRGVKWALNSDGKVLIYQNTFWTTSTSANGMDLITPIHNAVLRNNIFQTGGYSFYEVQTGSTGNDWNNDDLYNARASSGPHFKWENVNYNNVTALCAASGLECQGYEELPGFANPDGGDFTLLASSPNIDRGVVIPGINNDFKGDAPDLGAYEFALVPSPKVLSITRVDADPTNADSVNFTVTFSEDVSGVNTAAPFSDFGIATTAGISGTAIKSVTPLSAATYAVSVNTGAGNGMLRLDVLDDDTILNAGGQPLGGRGVGNGSFTSGEIYTINKFITTTLSVSFKSVKNFDGWVLESGENTNVGRAQDKNSTTLYAGDDKKDRQYRSILSFDTSSLPDNAVIVSAQVDVKRQGVVGTDPFSTHGVLLLEIRNGAFSKALALQASDFSDAASPGSVRDQFAPLTFTWYRAELSAANLPIINKYGATQFRLFFSRDDNDDQNADYVKFFSGNSTEDNKPVLTVTYYVP